MSILYYLGLVQWVVQEVSHSAMQPGGGLLLCDLSRGMKMILTLKKKAHISYLEH